MPCLILWVLSSSLSNKKNVIPFCFVFVCIWQVAQTKTIAWGKHYQRVEVRDVEGERRKEMKPTQSNYIGLSNWLQVQYSSKHCRSVWEALWNAPHNNSPRGWKGELFIDKHPSSLIQGWFHRVIPLHFWAVHDCWAGCLRWFLPWHHRIPCAGSEVGGIGSPWGTMRFI